MVELAEMRCGLVALVGVPNAGKSTLINALVGEKLGIVSPKPNTTRVVVRGVRTDGVNQLIFMDTPGINQSAAAFDRRLVQQAQGAMHDADIVVIVASVEALPGGGKKRQRAATATDNIGNGWARERQWAAEAGKNRQRVVVALTKIDKMKDKAALLPLLTEINAWGVDAVVPIAAIRGATKASGIDRLVGELVKMLPAGPWLFPPEQVTDMPLPLRLAEMTREQVMRLMHQEIPYGVGVVTETVEEVEEGLMLVQQQVLVAKEQHKAMVVGAGGQMLKEIGSRARKEMQEVVGHGVRLELHVKVAERWAEREEWLRGMGI